MKKILLFFCLFFNLSSIAQLPNGSIAPDFTLTDIGGVTHTLSNYLNANKTVILEFSGSSCGASWKYLRRESLQDFYNAFGNPGSNEVVVLFIEASTNVQYLQGISNPPAFGNWLQGSPFPFILSPATHTLYSINYEPTIYKICPNGIISEVGQSSALNLKALANQCEALSGVQNYARLLNDDNGFCNSLGAFKLKIRNYGTNKLNSVTLKLQENGVSIATKTFPVNVEQFSTTTLEFDPILINRTSSYSAQLVTVNGVANYNNSFTTVSLPFHIATSKPASGDYKIKVHTYICPNNMSWKISNSSGTAVVAGGPYGTPGSSCNGPMNTTVEQNLSLPAEECFTLSLMDAGGFGWKNYSGNSPVPTEAGVELFLNDSLIYRLMNVENFGSLLEVKNFFTTRNPIIPENNAPNEMKIYPNPSSGNIHVQSKSNFSMQIFDFTGRRVFYSEGLSNNSTINLSKLASGIYIVQIVSDNNNKVTKQKLIINR